MSVARWTPGPGAALHDHRVPATGPLLRAAAGAAGLALCLAGCAAEPAAVTAAAAPVVSAPTTTSATAPAGGTAAPVVPTPAAALPPAPTVPSAAATGPPDPASFRTYRNPRFGFSADVPAGFTAGDEPANGDGLAFTSPDGAVRVQLVGENNALDQTSTQLRVDDLARAQARGSTVTYDVHHDAVTTLSGRSADGTTTFYAVTHVTELSIQRMTWLYPTALQATVAPLLERAADTFTPGDGG